MRMNFQGAIKETSEQIKIRLKDKQIPSILTDVIGASFAANVIQLASPGSEVNSYWSCTRPFSFFPTQYTEKSSLATRDYVSSAIKSPQTSCLCYFCKLIGKEQTYACFYAAFYGCARQIMAA